jgi:predicted aspartyl protease
MRLSRDLGTIMFASARLTLLCKAILAWFVVLQTATQQSSAPAANQSPASSASAATPAAAPSLPPSPLHDALLLYRKGDFDGAIRKYQQLLTGKSVPEAYAGLIRTYLKKKDVPQAHETAARALSESDAPALRVAVAEVYFREGKIPDAEREWVNVINSGHPEPRAYLGLARVRWAVSMYKSGWAMIDKAHTLDPEDPEIQMLWTEWLPTAERIKFLEDYLAASNNEDEEIRTGLRHYLEYLKARARDPRGSCHLVSKATSTEVPLVRLLLDPTHLRGFGLSVEVNGHRGKLMLDTGASGLLLNRSLAEKAGVTRLADVNIGGVGDKGPKSGYRALASSLKVGGLEFQNCTVEVVDKRSVVDEEGLVGADVFSSFLVDIDFPNEKLRLGELPTRPDETAPTIKLNSEGSQSDTEQQRESQPDTQVASGNKDSDSGLRDRFIAPEMKDYTRFYRFDHFVLVPTMVANAPGKLFMVDTGATTNDITPAAAREITKVHGDSE